MTRARTSRNRATRSTLTCSTPRTAQAPTLGNRLPRRSTAMAPAAMGVTRVLPLPSAPGLNWLTPPTPTLELGQGRGSPTSGPGLGGYTTPRHLRRDGRAGTGPSHAAARGLRMAAPAEAGRATRPDCGRHPLTGSLRGTAVLGPYSRALALRSLRCVLCGGRTHGVLPAYSRGTHGVLAAT